MPLDPAKVRARRTRLRLSQAAAAARVGMAQSHWARIEAGQRSDPQLSTAEKIAHALRCRLTALCAAPQR